VYGEENNILSRGLEQSRQDKISTRQPNEPIKEGPLLFALFESPFSSVSTVSRGHPSLVFLVIFKTQEIKTFYGLKLQKFLLFRSSSPFPSKISVLKSSLLSYVLYSKGKKSRLLG
jgi:hypothetical protein